MLPLYHLQLYDYIVCESVKKMSTHAKKLNFMSMLSAIHRKRHCKLSFNAFYLEKLTMSLIIAGTNFVWYSIIYYQINVISI